MIVNQQIMAYSGSSKAELNDRLGDDWRKLAAVFDIHGIDPGERLRKKKPGSLVSSGHSL